MSSSSREAWEEREEEAEDEPLATELNINGTRPMKKDENPIARDWKRRLANPILGEKERKGWKPFEGEPRLSLH